MRIEKAAIIRLFFIKSQPFLRNSSRTFWRGLFVLKKILSISSSIQAKRGPARLLLLLANFGKEGKPEPVIAKISQETLAEMIGTTRARVSFFMNKFRKLGFIEYNLARYRGTQLIAERNSARSTADQDLMQRFV